VNGNPIPVAQDIEFVSNTSHGWYPHRYVFSTTYSTAEIKIDSLDLACTSSHKLE
jgi:hypothetical protein